jgi:bifunctional enzyme CysN/CysC
VGEMKNTRDNLRIVVVGHVDHGKSTLIGRLLYDTESLPEGAIEKVKRICKEKGKFFEYAYLLDAFEEEQKQGITIDTTQIQFFTKKRDYVIIDAPGHKEFLKNMISGAANAEAALLIIDAQEGIQEQSKRHGYILSLLGIKQVYVIVNKMDLIDYSAEKFQQIKDEFDTFLHSLNVFPVKYIPISAFLGENITTNSPRMPWYNEHPILEALDLFEKEKGHEEKPLRFPIQDVYKFDNRRIIAGRIETGQLRVGDKILISPGTKTTTVKSIEYWADQDKKAVVSAGLSVGITVSDEFFNKRGELISSLEEPPLKSSLIKANLVWMGKKDLTKNTKYKLKLTTQEVECEIVSIDQVIDAASLKTLQDAERVRANDVAEVVIKTKQAVCFDRFSANQSTGRFVLVDGYDVTGGGIISNIHESAEEQSSYTAIAGMEKLVHRSDWELRDNQRGKVIWITGPDEAKYHLAVSVEKELFDIRKRVFYLDDDAITGDLNIANSSEQVDKVAEVARLLVRTGMIVIVATGEQITSDLVKQIIGAQDFISVQTDGSYDLNNQLNDLVNLVITDLYA